MKKLILILLSLVGVAFYFTNDSIHVDSIGDGTNLHSDNAKLVELNTGEVLFEKGASEKIYPASLTKIMTAILAIEHFHDLKARLEIDDRVLHELMLQNASVAGYSAGDEPTVEDLLYATILSSGADATSTLAIAIAGSEKEFAKLMNEQAARIGMNQTNFVNASGLHDPNHYSTVQDLSKLLAYALQNNEFENIFKTTQYVTTPVKSNKDGITLQSTMFSKLGESELLNGAKIIGGKTGYTPQAGLCLASLVERDDKLYFLITTNADGSIWTDPYHIEDAVLLYSSL